MPERTLLSLDGRGQLQIVSERTRRAGITGGAHGPDHRRRCGIAHADHRLCYDQTQAGPTRRGRRSSKAFKPVSDWFSEKKPGRRSSTSSTTTSTSFFFDHYSAFALGIGEEYPPPTKAAARATCRRSQGTRSSPRTSAPAWSPTSSTCPSSRTSRSITGFSPHVRAARPAGRPVAGEDRPAAGRRPPVPDPVGQALLKLGKALRRAIESYPEDIDVAIVSTGGLSHQVHGERAGFNNLAWDERSSTLIEKDPTGARRDDPRASTRRSAASKAPR